MMTALKQRAFIGWIPASRTTNMAGKISNDSSETTFIFYSLSYGFGDRVNGLDWMMPRSASSDSGFQSII
jgi:hypothetical protein